MDLNSVNVQVDPPEAKPPKKKIKKWLKALLIIIGIIVALFLAVVIYAVVDTLVLSKNNGERKVYEIPIEEQSIEYYYSDKSDIFDGETTHTPIKISDKSVADFEAFLDKTQPEYKYSDLYDYADALAKYNQKHTVRIDKHKHDIRVNGKLDPQTLYLRVLENNETFFNDSKHSKGFYEIPSKKEIKELCEQICIAVPEYVKNYPQIDLDAVCCNLYNLKIMSNISSFSNANINNEMVFNYDKKQMDVNKNLMNTDDIYTTVFYHEMVHLCQFCCDCYDDYENEWRVGINHYYDDLKVNPLMWSWFAEGAAERIMARQLSVDYTTYMSYIGYLTSLEYIAQIGSDINPIDVELLTFERDTEKIYEMFDVTDGPRKTEFMNMMYSIEALQIQPSGFEEAYKALTGEDISERKTQEAFRLEIKKDPIITMTRLFYRNLIRCINARNVTLEDAYFLAKVWESKVLHHFSNSTYGFMLTFRDTYDKYLEIQNEFFRLVALENDMSVESLENGFQEYALFVKGESDEKKPNCDLEFFSDENRSFTEEFIERYHKQGKPTVLDCISLYERCKKDVENYHIEKQQNAETTTESAISN